MTKLQELYGFQLKQYKGKAKFWDDLFGVELELENLSALPEIDAWNVKNDNSLRNGYEFILRVPLGGDELKAAIERFYSQKLRYTNGPRTSTHIHVNATDMTVDQLRTMIILMYTIEDALFLAIGEMRKWAGYAMPLRDMEPNRLREILSSNDLRTLMQNISTKRNQDRYYGFNISVQKHGTVEFRYFPGGPTKEELTAWVDLVHSIKKAAMNNALQGLANYAYASGDLVRFLRDILPEYWYTKLLGLTTPEQLLENFSEVAALCFGDEAPKRREPLVFASAPLMRYISKSLFGENAGSYLLDVCKTLPVMTLGDWSEHLHKAWDMEFQNSDAAKKNPVKPNKLAGYAAYNLRDYAQFGPDQRYEEVIQQVQQQVAQREQALRARAENLARVPPPRPPAQLNYANNVWQVLDDANEILPRR
jgi:hypothetical protein